MSKKKMKLRFLRNKIKKRNNNVDIILEENEAFGVKDLIELKNKYSFSEILRFCLVIDKKRFSILEEHFEKEKEAVFRLEEILNRILEEKEVNYEEFYKLVIKQVRKNKKILSSLKIDIPHCSLIFSHDILNKYKFSIEPKPKTSSKLYSLPSENIKSFSEFIVAKEIQRFRNNYYYCNCCPFSRFPGGKTEVFKYYSKFYNFFKLFNSICEPFAGSGITSYTLFKHSKNLKVFLNDIHKGIYLKHKIFIEHPEIFNLLSLNFFLLPLGNKLKEFIKQKVLEIV